MLITIPSVLDAHEVTEARSILDAATWVDGKVTAGVQSASVKHNQQVAETDPAARQVGDWIIKRLEQHPLFISAALPLKVFPPLFNRYGEGHTFGTHVDNAIRQITGTPYRIRTDLSATLFLSEPDTYDGGELCIEDTYGTQRVKLPAGDMVLYPATSLHYVTPVTKGVRVASFFWMQSMIRDDAQRTILFDLDATIQLMNQDQPHSEHAIRLTGIYHNLLRQWVEMG